MRVDSGGQGSGNRGGSGGGGTEGGEVRWEGYAIGSEAKLEVPAVLGDNTRGTNHGDVVGEGVRELDVVSSGVDETRWSNLSGGAYGQGAESYL